MSDLLFVAYFEPHTFTTVWYQDLLYRFWQHGLRYHRFPRKDPYELEARSWQEELHTRPESLYLSGSQRFEGTVSQWLERVQTSVQGSLLAYDRWVEIQVTLQPHAQFPSDATRPLQRLGRVEMRYDEGHFHEDGPSSVDPLPRYLQIWQAYLHWSEVCCRILSPLYACGFLEGYQREEGLLADSGEHDFIEQPLLQGRLPEIAQIVSLPPMLQYFNPRLTSQENIKSLLHQPNTSSHYLPKDGVLHVAPQEPFSFGFGLAYNYRNLTLRSL